MSTDDDIPPEGTLVAAFLSDAVAKGRGLPNSFCAVVVDVLHESRRENRDPNDDRFWMVPLHGSSSEAEMVPVKVLQKIPEKLFRAPDCRWDVLPEVAPKEDHAFVVPARRAETGGVPRVLVRQGEWAWTWVRTEDAFMQTRKGDQFLCNATDDEVRAYFTDLEHVDFAARREWARIERLLV